MIAVTMLPSLGQYKPTAVDVVREQASAQATCIINKVCWDRVCGPCTVWWIWVVLASRVTWSARCALDETNSEYSQNVHGHIAWQSYVYACSFQAKNVTMVFCRFLYIGWTNHAEIFTGDLYGTVLKSVAWFQPYSYQLHNLYMYIL